MSYVDGFLDKERDTLVHVVERVNKKREYPEYPRSSYVLLSLILVASIQVFLATN